APRWTSGGRVSWEDGRGSTIPAGFSAAESLKSQRSLIIFSDGILPHRPGRPIPLGARGEGRHASRRSRVFRARPAARRRPARRRRAGAPQAIEENWNERSVSETAHCPGTRERAGFGGPAPRGGWSTADRPGRVGRLDPGGGGRRGADRLAGRRG